MCDVTGIFCRDMYTSAPGYIVDCIEFICGL